MNIGCVYSVEDYVTIEKPLSSPASIPFGISSIATVLKNAGHNVEILVFTPATPITKVIESFIEQSKPKMFCLTSVSTQFSLVCKIAESIKRINPSIFVVLGGHHASLNPDEAIKVQALDAICIGEGEKAVVELAAQVESGKEPIGIPNLWIKHVGSGDIERNPQDPFIEDLDTLPYIDRDMWEPWITDPRDMPSILLGRGCPFRCTYCSNHAMAKISPGKYVRFRSPEHVIGEINYILERNPSLESIYLEVETFGAILEHSFNLCASLKKFNSEREKPINFGVNLAVTRKIMNNTRLLESFKEANIKFVNIGLESGSERIRNEILRRPKYTNKDIFGFCGLAQKHSIKVNMYVLVGLPGETLADFKETVKCVRECQPQHVFLSIYHPYPGTDLYETAIRLGVLNEEKMQAKVERRKSYLDLPGFSKVQVKKEYILFNYNVYKGRWPRGKIIAHSARLATSAYPRLNGFYRYLLNRSRTFAGLKERLASFNNA